MWNRWGKHYGCSSLQPWESFQAILGRVNRWSQVDSMHWEMELSPGRTKKRVCSILDGVLERSVIPRETLMLYKGTPWVFSRVPVSTCLWRTTWGWGRKFPKWLEGIVSGADTGPGAVPVPTSQTGKPLIHGALDRVLRKICLISGE